jgi:hypothetical protein
MVTLVLFPQDVLKSYAYAGVAVVAFAAAASIVVTNTSRVVAEPYLADTETILVRFPNNVIWAYRACPLSIWRSFTASSILKGQL